MSPLENMLAEALKSAAECMQKVANKRTYAGVFRDTSEALEEYNRQKAAEENKVNY